ncbi:MAG: type IV pilin [Thermoplasmata archaeon]|nr:type IV pilin [Thermoplasmata archaeon]MCI4344172.1 type IV pilin [Thermoplasmata archaeon]
MHRRFTRRRPWRAPNPRGVSDVVATILLLALTVTLFASIFFFVNTFPRPPPQPANQFAAQLLYGGAGGLHINGITILHLAGPTLTGSILFYLQSAAHPTFVPNPFTLANGLNGSTTWGLGQTWYLNMASFGLTAPDNLSVSIVSTTELLFRTTLPGSNPNIPPTFLTTGTSPATPTIGGAVQIQAQIVDDDLRNYSVYVNLSQIPGVSVSGPQLMSYLGSIGMWVYNISAGTTSQAGTFFAFVNATDQVGQIGSVAIPVTVVSPTSSSIITVSLLANPSAPIKGSGTTVTSLVTNNGGSSLPVTLAFLAAGTNVGSASGTIGGGQTSTFSITWTPTTVGAIQLVVDVTISGGGSGAASLNLTVWPKILFIAHDQISGQRNASNESAYFANELVADGVPFTSMFVACTAALPSQAALDAYGLVIVDFGSANAGGCKNSPSTAEQAKLQGTNFIVTGAALFAATTSASYGATFLTNFGITSAATVTATVTAATTTLTYTASVPNRLRADGVPATLKLNQTLAGSAAFTPISYFKAGTTNPAWLKDGSNHAIGSWFVTGGHNFVALGTDPSLLTTPLTPSANSWGTGAAGAAVVYNLVGFAGGIATSGSAGRALYDFGISGAVLLGQHPSSLTTIYAALRENGATGATVTATLYVNGSVAVYQGIAVTASVTLSFAGNWSYVSLFWQAPGAGSYTLSVVLTVPGSQFNLLDDQMPISLLNQPSKFT